MQISCSLDKENASLKHSARFNKLRRYYQKLPCNSSSMASSHAFTLLREKPSRADDKILYESGSPTVGRRHTNGRGGRRLVKTLSSIASKSGSSYNLPDRTQDVLISSKLWLCDILSKIRSENKINK